MSSVVPILFSKHKESGVSPVGGIIPSATNSAPKTWWLDGSDKSVNSISYIDDSLEDATASGAVGTKTITTSTNLSSTLVAGQKIKMGGTNGSGSGFVNAVIADTYTIASVSGTAVTTVENLTATYNDVTLLRATYHTLGDKFAVVGNAVQSVHANKAVYATDNLIYLLGLEEGGYVTANAMNNIVEEHMFLVANIPVSDTGAIIGSVRDAVGGTNDYAVFFGTNPASIYYVVDGSRLLQIPTTKGTLTLYEAQRNVSTNTISLYKNGVLLDSLTPNPPALNMQYILGNNADSLGLRGAVGEVVMYKGILNTAERLGVIEYLRTKWSLW